MKTMQSIKPFLEFFGSGDRKCGAREAASHASDSCALRLVTGILLAIVISSPLLAAAVESPLRNSDSAIKVEVSKNTWTNGEIKNIDTEMGKLAIKHDRLVNLHMPAMTMLFKVNKSSLCDGLKVGDKVRFSAESLHGSLVITALEKQP